MGFRSTFVTQECLVGWPEWFREKYKYSIRFPPDGHVGALSSIREFKCYLEWQDLEEDIQKAVDWRSGQGLVLVYLHECGGITRCRISKDSIEWKEPSGWKVTNDITHNYCYGCSD